MGIACIPAIPVIFEVNQIKVWTFYIYSLLRFFKFPYNFCGDFRRTCNPRDNYMHGLRTPNEGINQRNLKNWADVAKIWQWEWIFGRAVKTISSLGVCSP